MQEIASSSLHLKILKFDNCKRASIESAWYLNASFKDSSQIDSASGSKLKN
jgi:hypothetical protein